MQRIALAVCLSLSLPTMAAVSAQAAAKLGSQTLTCMGAQRAGTANGVAAFTGKYLGTWPGLKDPAAFTPGPWADEKPLFTITAQNKAKYAKFLTPGQQALFAKYPDAFRMPVYPSHRDFAFPEMVCKVNKINATTAKVVHDGKGVQGTTGGVPFPLPQTGLEAIWNVGMAYRPWSEEVTYKTADVYNNGSTVWGKAHYRSFSPQGPARKPGSFQDEIAAYFYISYLLPERDKGKAAVGFVPFDYSTGATTAWTYMPGLRRVRQAPKVGFDYPVPPSGMHTSDDEYLFNGSPERFNWTILGKREVYVPYNNFGINSPDIPLDALTTVKTLNPDYMRYELHRVWVIQGMLKDGVRHVYGKRVLFVDEDSWLPLWADNYDTRGQLWRPSYQNLFYSPVAKAFVRGVTVYHDLNLKAYEATYLVNDTGAKGWWQFNKAYDINQFTPAAIARGGH